MGMTNNNLYNSCTNIGCGFQSGIVRTTCAFYMPPQLEPDNCGNYVVQEPTTKNCETCEYYGSHHEVCNYCYECSLWTEKEPTTKNDLGVDLISRADVLKLMKDNWHTHNGDWAMQESMDDIRALPSVTPQEPIRPKGKWISYHCGAYYECSNCHERNNSRYDNYCPNCGCRMLEPQESEDKE